MHSTLSDSIARLRSIADRIKGQANPLHLADAVSAACESMADALEALPATAPTSPAPAGKTTSKKR